MDLDSLIALNIRTDGWLRELRREKRSVPSHTRASTDPTSPPRNPRGPRHLHYQENPTLPVFPQVSQMSADSPPPEPVQLGRARLSHAERLRRLNSKSCMYCGTTGHFISTCPLKRPGLSVGTSTLLARWWAILVPLSMPSCCGVTGLNLSGYSLILGPNIVL